MTKTYFDLKSVHPSWHTCLTAALQQMDVHYLEKLCAKQNWLPGAANIFNAFSLPVNKVNYLLFGESPYPRAASANGYAFWDAAVTHIWSPKGLSTKVNRATSLRNLIKMLLVAEGLLKPPHCAQPDIVAVDKTSLIQTNDELFSQLLHHGFLLLNASLVLDQQVKQDARAWHPFLSSVIKFLIKKRPQLRLVLLGNIAQVIEKNLPVNNLEKLCAEHPYNHTFITNREVLHFFRPLHLLIKTK